jgi:hypothetical protein
MSQTSADVIERILTAVADGDGLLAEDLRRVYEEEDWSAASLAQVADAKRQDLAGEVSAV